MSVFASVNAAKGSEKGNGTEWTETTTDSGKTVTINSGRDTVLNGAQVNGNRIIADVGHDLLISSQQDTSKYDSKQTSVAAGGSFTFGSMTGSGYIAASRDKMKSRFDSVAEQTGMFAGDGGFDITVGRHTQLEGAVIASTATPDKNHLDTGTLGFSDLHNEADYKVSHSGISLSGGGSFGDKFQGNMPGGMMSAGGHSGHAEGTTQAAVAEGTITIRDRDNQKQNLANLSRDPAHANDSISPIFDKEKEQRRLQTVGLISDIGSQVADIARTQGELNVLKAAKEAIGEVLPANATEKQRQEYLAKLRDTQAYRNEMAKYGTGSEIQRGIQAATAALQGLAGDNLAGALAGASAPELAHLLKSTEKDPAVNAIAHAILGGAVAAMQGNNIAAGAAGAATGELAARAIAGMLYPGVKQSDLSEEQKQTISTLATVSAGLAGGLTGNSTASAAVGAQSGKNAVENNLLGGSEWLQTEKAREHGADVLSCSDNPSGEACKRGQAENKAYAAALATSSVSLLPRSAQAMWALGAGANAGIGSMVDSSVDPENAIIAGWVNVITMGQGWKGTVGWNAAGGAFGNWLDGKDPLSGAAMSGGTSAIGYGVGKVVQGPLEKVINPNWKNWEWLNVGMGISKPLPLNPTPGIAGNIGSSIGSEGSGAIIQEQLKNQQEKK
ncbi:TPA: hemagglutinin repeat-containing protein [Escherichia coli]|nr:hemagglutinin repeat-containing protein [Escherichia coli]HCQ1637634.1 hemagglutinin repeat-containing protein [Escherichia coli]